MRITDDSGKRIPFVSFAQLSFALSVLLILLTVLFLPPAARAEKVNDLVIESALTDDDVLRVEETFTVDFGEQGDYVIYRIIPIVAKVKDNLHRYQFKLEAVLLDEDPDRYTLDFDSGNAILQVGNTKKLLKGKHAFSIRYNLRKIAAFSPSPSIHWDCLGEGWPFALANVSVTLQLPHSVPPKQVAVDVLRIKSKEPGETLYQVNGNEISVTLPRVEPGEGLLLSLDLPRGTIVRPEWDKELFWLLADWWQAIVFPLFAYVTLAAVRWTCDRIQSAPQLVSDEFALPSKLSPSELGALLDNRCEIPDMVAELFNLASRGYLRIKEVKSEQFVTFSNCDFEFVRLKSIDDAALEPHQKILLQAIFASDDAVADRVLLSGIKNKFHLFEPRIEAAVYRQLIEKNQWIRLPKEVAYSYFAAGSGLLVIGLVIALLSRSGISACALGFVGAALVTYSFAPTMPALTITGCKSLRQTKAIRGFLLTSDDAQIRRLFSGGRTVLNRFFAYAVVLGAADKLARGTQDVLTSPPSWYSAYKNLGEGEKFSSEGFVTNLGSGMRTIERSFALSAVTDMSERVGES